MKRQACVAKVDLQFLIANPSQMLLGPCRNECCKHRDDLCFPGTDATANSPKHEVVDAGFLFT